MAANALWEAVTILHELPQLLAQGLGDATLPGGADGNHAHMVPPARQVYAKLDAPPPEAVQEESTRSFDDPRPTRALEEHSEHAIPVAVFPESPYSELDYRGGRCEGVFVYLVTVFEDSPRDSAVTFATSAAEAGAFAHPGQKVGPWEVLAITEDWTGMMPVVWLVQNQQVCRTGLTGNPERVRAIQARALRDEAARRRAQRLRQRRRRR